MHHVPLIGIIILKIYFKLFEKSIPVDSAYKDTLIGQHVCKILSCCLWRKVTSLKCRLRSKTNIEILRDEKR